jgi:hypothetical protein
VVLLPLPLKPGRSRGYEPDEERCLGYGSFDKNSSDAGSSVISRSLKNRENDVPDGS